MQHHAAITMRFTALTCKLAPIYAQNNTRTADDKSYAAIPMRSATGDSKTPYNYAHTQAHPKQLQATVTLRQKKTTNRPQLQPSHTRGTFHRRLQPLYPGNTRFRAPASSPKHSPCNIMQPLQCGSQHQLANLHLSTHRTRPEQQMTRVMQPFQCDLQPEIPKHPITTHTQAHPKQLQATVTLRQKKRQTDRSRNRRTHEVPFIVACSHLTRKTTRFRAPASSPKHSPCNVMQPLQCGSQHQLANLHLSTHRTRPEQQTTRVMQPCQCDLQPEIPKHPIATHTQAHPKQLQATVTLRQKNDKPTAAATVAHTRYLSSSPAATLHGKTQGFVLRFPPQNIAHATSCKLAPICAQNNTRTADDKSHAAIPMRSATGDSKTPYNYAHKSTPKAASSHRYTVAKKTTNRPQPQPSHTRGTFHRRLQPLYTEKHKFSCSGFLPKT